MMNYILQFKISLNYSKPKIWRRIQVPNNYTFWDLHCAIQDAMGWTNSHLHAFYITDKQSHSAKPIIIQMPEPHQDGLTPLHEAHEYLADWFPTKIKQCIYTYDFGDSWDHTVLFEHAVAADHPPYPRCLAGEQACPPEDCGGTGGYADLLKAIHDPKTAYDFELRDWMGLEVGEIYDPTNFSVDQVVFSDPTASLKEYLDHVE